MLGLTAPLLISRVITLLIAFTFHELAHAWTAVQLGDDTPRRMGRLTLNPLAHLDPIGTLLLIVAGFGWAKPVPVNPYNLRNGPGLGMAIVAAAGPLANLLMAILAAVPIRLGLISLSGPATIARLLPSPAAFLQDFIFLNLILMLFNLIPIPPLDGSKILRGLAPRGFENIFVTLEQWGPFLLMALVFLGAGIVGAIIGGPAAFLFHTITGV